MTQDAMNCLFSGTRFEVEALKGILELNNIEVMMRDRFNEGLHAGFVDGIAEEIDLFVLAHDLDRATIICKDFIESEKRVD